MKLHAVKSNVIAVVIASNFQASQQHHVTQQMPSLIVHLGQILHSSADFLQGQLHVLVEDLPETTEMLGQYVFTQIIILNHHRNPNINYIYTYTRICTVYTCRICSQQYYQ